MEFRKKSTIGPLGGSVKILIKIAFISILLLLIVVLVDKINFPYPNKTRFFFDFITFFIEKTQICLNLKLINDICNFKKKQVLVRLVIQLRY